MQYVIFLPKESIQNSIIRVLIIGKTAWNIMNAYLLLFNWSKVKTLDSFSKGYC